MFSTNDLFTIILNLAFSAGSSGFDISGSGGSPVNPPV